MRTRLIIAIALAVVAVPFVFLGLIDPLEGGIALLAAIALGVVARLLSRVPFPKLTWIPMVTAVAIGVITLGLAILPAPVETAQGVGRGGLWLPIIVLLWTYRIAVVVALVGAVAYVVRLIRTARAPRELPQTVTTR